MISRVNIIFRSSVNKSHIREFHGLTVEEANLLIPTDGYVCLQSFGQYEHYKVDQIVKTIHDRDLDASLELLVYVFVRKITNNDYYLLSNGRN